jgi:hypothetical protein
MDLHPLSSLPASETCPDCFMPDNSGDCNHTRLSMDDLARLGLFDDSAGPEGQPRLRWATPFEVEVELNGEGIEGAEWIQHPTVDGFADLAVPR